jgi:hypothetical protein
LPLVFFRFGLDVINYNEIWRLFVYFLIKNLAFSILKVGLGCIYRNFFFGKFPKKEKAPERGFSQ